MKKGKRRRIVAPDESFSAGPFQMARFGRHVVSRMNWAPGEFEAAQERLAANYDAVVNEIDVAIEDAARLVSSLPPLKLMHRAWWSRAAAMLGISSEIEIGQQEVLAERMVDYVQSLIAGYPRATEQKSELSDEDWVNLENLVEKIFSTINSSYFIGATAKRRRDGEELSPALEEFHFQLQLYWVNVKASQYQVHQIQALRELLEPQSNIIEVLYGITVSELCDELAKVQHAQAFGIADAFGAMEEFQKTSMDLLQSDLELGLIAATNPEKMLGETIERHGLREEADRVFGLMFGHDLLDVEKVSSLPESFLRDFSWEPGQDSEFFSEGEFRGWPLRIWPTFKRPFMKLEDRYYCFDSSSLFDRVYRQIEKRAFALGEAQKQQWVASRQRVTEELPFAYLERILPGARVLKGIYYKVIEEGKSTKWAELDGLVMFDDHLFVMEVKAGAFTYTSPATDSKAHLSSLAALIADPAKQGNRFLKYLMSADEVALFDQGKKEVLRLSHSRYRHISLCAITLDPFTEMAAQSQRLSEIGISSGEEPVWSMSIDDLRVYSDIFDNPYEFLHFSEQRTAALRSKLLRLDDELDHLGLYLKHNQYELHARELAGDTGTSLAFTGYRLEIDKFFAEKFGDSNRPSPLRQKMPDALAALLDILGKERRPGGAKLASQLLDLSGDLRDSIFVEAEKRFREAKGGRIGPASTSGEVRVTLQLWCGDIDRDIEESLSDHVKALLVLNSERDRLLLILRYDTEMKLQGVSWRWIAQSDIVEGELERIRSLGERLRLRRLDKAKAKGKVGRNDPCPCASGKKYKKCCLV